MNLAMTAVECTKAKRLRCVFGHAVPTGFCRSFPARHRRKDGLFALIQIAILVVPVAAQRDATISGTAGCSECRIVLAQRVSLGTATGMGSLQSSVNYVTVDRRGRYYVSSPDAPHVWAFDQSGALKARIGRSGSGPGEFRTPTLVLIGRADSLFIFDRGLGRLSVFDTEYVLARTVNLSFPPGFRGLSLRDGFVLNTSIRTADRAGYPLHWVGHDGTLGDSFGSVDGVYRSDLREILEDRPIARAADDLVWSAWINRYAIELWDLDGTLRRTVRRDASWFDEWWRPEADANTPPVPYVVAMQQVKDTLWVMTAVPDTQWQTAVIQEPNARMYTVSDPDGYRDTMIEAIDLRTNAVLVSARVPEVLVGFLQPGIVYGQATDPALNPIIRVWELRVENQSSRR